MDEITPSPATSTLLGSAVIAARYRGVHLSASRLRRDHRLGQGEPTVPELLRIIRANGLRAECTRLTRAGLEALGPALPVIVLLHGGVAMVLLDPKPRASVPSVVLADPNAGEGMPLVIDQSRFEAAWTGEVILVKRDWRVRDEAQPFGLRMIVGLLLRDRRIARDIAVAAFLLSLLAISPIIFWRLLIDKVVYFGNMNTFIVLCLAMLVLVGFETWFGFIRRYLVLHITRQVDAKLSVEIFNRLLNLPLTYFERSSTGEVARDASEIWKIRKFLTGQLFGTMLDAIVIVVILPVMFAYSAILTGAVLALTAIACVWLMLMLPVLRRKSGAVFSAEGQKSSFLVETLHGIRTVKSLALDAQRRQEWDVHVARTVDLRFEEGIISNIIQTVAHPLERLMTSGVFALAVYLVISTNGQVAMGSLIAFMMLTMRLASPLAQLTALLPEYDEARLAVDIIGRMINQPPEEGHGPNRLQTPIDGRIDFNRVRFRYPGATVAALDDVSFSIPHGTIFGIMGRSGSGKTTVTRLLQLLHSGYEGLIKIDGTDIRAYDIGHLRASIGVVLQENFLFRGSVFEIIASGRPNTTLTEVIRAARLAGAEEFIERLPRGYETWVEEGSTNLSGGQRQRLAIARALLGDPPILVLDEATSALDAESEAMVNQNLRSIARNRTVLIISHRLSSLMEADQILVLEQGRAYALGTHQDLLEGCDIYRMLWHEQHRHLAPPPQLEARP